MTVDVRRLFREMEMEAEEHELDAAALDRPRMFRLLIRASHVGRAASAADDGDVTQSDVDAAREALWRVGRFTVRYMRAYAPLEPPMPDDAVARPRFLPIVLVPDAYHHGTDDGPPEDTDCAAASAFIDRHVRPHMRKGLPRRRSATATSENSLLVRNVDRALAPLAVALLRRTEQCTAHVIEPWEWDDQTHVFVCWQ